MTGLTSISTLVIPITLTMAAAAALINFWLMMRVGQVRRSQNVSVGDGGNDAVIRRMRAHSNFGESTPVVLILIAALELSGWNGVWLWVAGYAFMAGRIAHGLGMDGGTFGKGRMIGTLLSMLIMIGLALTAIYAAITAM